MPIRVLFVYPGMHIGGSTTSLISLLTLLDREAFDVSLQLLENDGALQGDIPPFVHVLPQARREGSNKGSRRSARYILTMLRALYYQRVLKRPVAASQLRSLAGVPFDAPAPGEYDVAVSFLETWPTYYTVTHVRAKRYLAWIHTDYAASGMLFSTDKAYLERYERIVFVAQSCVDTFARLDKRLAQKAVVAENLLSSARVRALAQVGASLVPQACQGRFKLVTVCRMVPAKALPRAARVIARLKDDGVWQNACWLILGDGEERAALEETIAQHHLQGDIFLLGQTQTPLPTVKMCDLFFLPSVCEGKPMAVTESLMLGVPVLATDYGSARVQIDSGRDGLVTENTEDGLYEGLKTLLDHRDTAAQYAKAALSRDYDNITQVRAVEALLRGRASE